MKFNHILLFLALSAASISVTAQAAWTRVSPTPQENTINCITRIPGTERLIAVGAGSTVMCSDDAGESWTLSFNPAGMNNEYMGKGICFINTTTGFINGGRETILKTTDGGSTWRIVYMVETSADNHPINDMAFTSELNGFATGTGGKLLKTSDGGETWLPVDVGVTRELMQIEFAGSLTGYITDWTNQWLKTTDGGETWIAENFPQALPPRPIEDLCFVNDTTGFIFQNEGEPNYHGFIYKTTDAGLSWIQVYTSVSAYTCRFAFYNDQQGMAGCETWMYTSKILLTNDGGTTWSEVSPPPLPQLVTNSICYYDHNKALTAGYYGKILRTQDGGIHWEPLHERIFSGHIYDAQFLDQNEGFALHEVWEGGVSSSWLQRTLDGGQTWSNIKMTGGYEGACWFVNHDTGFVVAQEMDLVLFKTTNAGADWSEISTGYDFAPYEMRFWDAGNGLITGENIIIKTSDGGITWETVSPEPGSWTEYNDIEYRSASEVFVVGTGDYPLTSVFKSVDGGNSWQETISGGSHPANDIVFADNNTAFLGCFNSIQKSEDGGITWHETNIDNPAYIDIRYISFPSPQTGYAAGDGAFDNLLKTTDGGNNWFPIGIPTTSGLNFVHFFDDETGLVMGEGGVLMHTTTGGVTATPFQEISSATGFFGISPNPSAGVVTFTINQVLLASPAELTIYDFSGRLLKQFHIANQQTTVQWSGAGLVPGIYLCRLKTAGGISETKKMIRAPGNLQ